MLNVFDDNCVIENDYTYILHILIFLHTRATWPLTLRQYDQAGVEDVGNVGHRGQEGVRHKMEYGADIFLKSGYIHITGEVKGLYGIGVRYTGGYRYNQRIKAIKMDRL